MNDCATPSNNYRDINISNEVLADNHDEDMSQSSTSSRGDDELLSFIESSTKQFQQIVSQCWGNASDKEQPAKKRKQHRKHRKPKGVVFCTDEQGIRMVLPPKMSLWHSACVEHPCVESKRFHVKFRCRFRMPYQQHLELVEVAKESPIFERWSSGTKDAAGKPCAPIELLVLASLRYLGRGLHYAKSKAFLVALK